MPLKFGYIKRPNRQRRRPILQALSQRTQSIADYLRAPDLGQFQDASQASSGAPRSFCSGCCRSSQKPSSRISSIRPEPEGQDQAHGAAYPGESLDNLLGGQTIRGLDNPINNGPFCNPVNLTDPSAGQVCSKPHDFDSVINDSDHSIHGNNIQFYGTFHPDQAAIESGQLKPSMNGFVHEQARLYPTVDQSVLDTQVLNYYTEDQVPVFTELVRNFITFNNWHSDIPGVRTTFCYPQPLPLKCGLSVLIHAFCSRPIQTEPLCIRNLVRTWYQ